MGFFVAALSSRCWIDEVCEMTKGSTGKGLEIQLLKAPFPDSLIPADQAPF